MVEDFSRCRTGCSKGEEHLEAGRSELRIDEDFPNFIRRLSFGTLQFQSRDGGTARVRNPPFASRTSRCRLALCLLRTALPRCRLVHVDHGRVAMMHTLMKIRARGMIGFGVEPRSTAGAFRHRGLGTFANFGWNFDGSSPGESFKGQPCTRRSRVRSIGRG